MPSSEEPHDDVGYDLDEDPDPAEWLGTEEAVRLHRVLRAHEVGRHHVGENATSHAAIHVIIENRLAQGDDSVRAAYHRLRAAGLDRHTTIHALGSVVAGQIFAMMKEKKPFDPAMNAAFAEIDPEAWRSSVAPRRPDNQRAARPYKGRRRKR